MKAATCRSKLKFLRFIDILPLSLSLFSQIFLGFVKSSCSRFKIRKTLNHEKSNKENENKSQLSFEILKSSFLY